MAGPAGLGQIQFKPHTSDGKWQQLIHPSSANAAFELKCSKYLRGDWSKNCCKGCLLASCTRPRWVHWASTWSEPQFSEYWNWSPAAATAALGFHTPVSPSGAPCPPQPGRGWINCCSTHRGSSGCEFRSCFTSIRKAAISSKCLACRFRLRCVTGDDDYWKASIQIKMKWSSCWIVHICICTCFFSRAHQLKIGSPFSRIGVFS